jgi:SAM-dependent methyltransferase
MRLCCSCRKPFEDNNWQCPYCFYQPQKVEGHLAFAPQLAKDSEGFEVDYFARLAEMEAGNFWFRSRNRLLIWALQQHFPEVKTLLEIGCGTGFVLSGIRQAFPGIVLSGSDVFTEGLKFAAERLPGVELFQMDARRIPFQEQFDVVGAFDVLEHIKEDEEVLSQMYQATRRGGGIMITVPHHPFLWSASDDYARHVRRYKTSELKTKVKRAGFQILRTTSFVSLLMPLLALSRFKQRLKGSEFDASSEFQISSLMNKTLEGILGVERGMIRAGVLFPAGGSVLLVARRD